MSVNVNKATKAGSGRMYSTCFHLPAEAVKDGRACACVCVQKQSGMGVRVRACVCVCVQKQPRTGVCVCVPACVCMSLHVCTA